VDDFPSPWNLRSKWPTLLSNTEILTIDQYPLIAPQPWELAKKVQLALIGSRPRAFQRAINEPCTLPLRPPRGDTKRDFVFLLVKFNFCRKQSAAKFLCVKTSSSNVVATSFLYLTAHCGRHPHLPKICDQSEPPLQKTPISTDFA